MWVTKQWLPQYSECIYTILAKSISTNSTHQRVIELINTKKRRSIGIRLSGVDSKMQTYWRDQPEFERLLPNFFSLPFKISYHIGKAFIFDKKLRK